MKHVAKIRLEPLFAEVGSSPLSLQTYKLIILFLMQIYIHTYLQLLWIHDVHGIPFVGFLVETV